MTAFSDLDPRSKLLLVACLSSGAVIMSHWAFLSGLLAASILLLLLFGVNPWDMLKKTRVLFNMVIFIALMQSIFVPGGQALLTVGSINLLTTGGLMMAAEFILRMSIIAASAGILATSNSREIIQGMVQCKLPYEIAFMVSMGIRFLPVFAGEAREAMTAIQLRGVNLRELSWRQKLEVTASLFQPVVAGALIKARAISMSIEMRAFRAYSTRSSYLVLTLGVKDYVLISGGLLLMALTLAYYFYLY
jgi:energy-coupling factor transport system permease protein